MCFGRIILPIRKRMNPLLEHTITQLYTKEKLSDLYKDIPIATQCGLLFTHSNLPAVTCINMSTDFCKRYDCL
jgi:hypothetical protein